MQTLIKLVQSVHNRDPQTLITHLADTYNAHNGTHLADTYNAHNDTHLADTYNAHNGTHLADTYLSLIHI